MSFILLIVEYPIRIAAATQAKFHTDCFLTFRTPAQAYCIERKAETPQSHCRMTVENARSAPPLRA